MEGDVFTFEDPQFRGTTRRATEFGEIWYDQHTELTSQEFRLQSSADEAFRWTVGAQYWNQEMQLDDKSFNTFTYLETRPWFAPAFMNGPNPMFWGDAKTFQGAICAPGTEGESLQDVLIVEAVTGLVIQIINLSMQCLNMISVIHGQFQ